MKAFTGFSAYTGDDFAEHIRASIPGYDRAFELCLQASEYFRAQSNRAIDLGASDGRLSAALQAGGWEVLAVEPEKSFHAHLEKQKLIYSERTAIQQDYTGISFVAIIHTLPFLSKSQRHELFQWMASQLPTGAGIFVSEKCTEPDGHAQAMANSLYYEFKCRAFTPEEILTKERLLRGIMSPITFGETPQMAKDAGFKTCDLLHKDLLFSSYLITK